MIRPANPEDLHRLVDLSLAAFESVTWQRAVDREFGPLQGLDWRERWKRRVAKAFLEQTFLVLEEEGNILGYVCGTVDRHTSLGHIDILAVDPAAQGQGHGRSLLRGMEEHFQANGAAFVSLEALVDNEGANSLYGAEGYRELARHINWFKKLGVDS